MATSSQYGSFVPTNLVWDVAQLQEVDVTSPEFKELLVRLYQNINNIALVLNTKETGIYDNAFEVISGNAWFPNPNNSSATAAAPTLRQEILKVIPILTNIPPGVFAPFNHGITITALTQFVEIRGAANDTINNHYVPMTYGAAAGINIELNATQILITNNTAYTFNITEIVLRYLQN